MPNVYITDETRMKLERLVEAERRSLSYQIDFLCTERMKQLNIPDVTLSPSVNNCNSTLSGDQNQEKNP